MEPKPSSLTHSRSHSILSNMDLSPLPVMGMAGSKLRALTEGPGGQRLRSHLQSVTSQPVAGEGSRGYEPTLEGRASEGDALDSWRTAKLSPRPPAKPRL
ncbi:hypothetical protein CEP54_011330 [Fusarium duplospermum]|uniref:Uncharacterized protein n=1 Tax=Fusarium duplospermum TaxID=1325734 RepID=A0A428PF68_9HYPO|nr:hypothetical protein CEP54_011330 [Fusarium duplospermum]